MASKKVESSYTPGEQAGLPKGKPEGLEHVPSVAELAAAGLAHRVGDSHYRLTEQAHADLGAIMARNADRWRSWRNRSMD